MNYFGKVASRMQVPVVAPMNDKTINRIARKIAMREDIKFLMLFGVSLKDAIKSVVKSYRKMGV